MTHPTDALRLVPCPLCGMTDSVENATQESGLVIHEFASPAGGRACQVECACGARGPSARETWQAVAKWNRRAASASPLPEGGGEVDLRDKAEGLEADLRQAVLVAWKRGAEEWCRLNYPQWVEWLEACHAPAAPTGDAK